MDESLRAKIIDQFKSTQLGFVRIRKNLGITHFSDAETEEYLRRIILATPIGAIERRGKNYYFTCAEFNAVLTVNAGSLTIITAKKLPTINRFATAGIIPEGWDAHPLHGL